MLLVDSDVVVFVLMFGRREDCKVRGSWGIEGREGGLVLSMTTACRSAANRR